MKTLSNEILSDIIVHNKYARYLKDQKRRETYAEICNRVKAMHIKKFPNLSEEIEQIFKEFVLSKKILPSMRSMQFAGVPIERNPTRIYNCAYLPIEHPKAFSEIMFLLLGGTGVGYSVQYRHVHSLPSVKPRLDRNRRYVVGDSIEGWADAIRVLVESYFYGKSKINFDFGDIREKGTELVTSGGKAPGPGPLRICISKLESIFEQSVGRFLTPIECHDLLCFIADAVLAGGIRRAAMISLFSLEDKAMLTCKSGDWWELNPQRGRANNSVILKRGEVSYEEFQALWGRVKSSNAGEPGIYWTNDLDWGTNPCCEIALRPYQFCNLVETNVSDISSQEDFNARVYAASFIATLQAGYTDFHYLRPIWKTTTEEDALIGVGLTGIGSGKVLNYDIKQATDFVKNANVYVANSIGINTASRLTTVKPSGTSSIVLGCSSGVHAWHAEYYLRRIRVGKDEPIYQYLVGKLPELVEDDYFRPDTQAVISIPQEAPKNSIYRTEHSSDLFERAILFNQEWIRNGFVKGTNHNNVSCTLSLKEEDWESIGELLWAAQDYYNGMSVIPYDGGSYVQAPFEEITEEKFRYYSKFLHAIDLTEVKEEHDNTNLTTEVACAGGVCEIGV